MTFDPEEWLAADPDPITRAELTTALADDPDEVRRRFASPLGFGTAGIRGRLGAGPDHMNEVLVRSVAAGLAEVVWSHHVDPAPPLVVIARDGRHGSERFAIESARSLAGSGIAVALVEGPSPTPLLAFAVRHLGAEAGIMVTASHNPRDDNGIKVYWRDGVQISPPIDQAIARAISSVGVVSPSLLAAPDDDLITTTTSDLVDAFVAARLALLQPAGPRAAAAVYTPLHGVGAELAERLVADAGFPPLEVVAAQATPDPDFPGLPRPNPEEPGALDLAMAQAQSSGVDLVVANDPDADRFAAAVRHGATWRSLTGDEIGALLAEHLLSRTSDPDRLVATTVVSSRLLASLARAHDVHHAETLTGFKWIMRPAFAHPELDFVLGYEEALGYAVDTEVADKDGLAALLLFLELAADAAAAGETVIDRLHAIFARHGVHRTGQRSIRFDDDPNTTDGAERQAAMMHALRSRPPTDIAGHRVERCVDLLPGVGEWAPTDALVFEVEGGARLVVRPSGTEPKVKFYAEVVTEARSDVAEAEGSADIALAHLLDAALGLATQPT